MKKVLISILILVFALFCLNVVFNAPQPYEATFPTTDPIADQRSGSRWQQLVEESAQLRQQGDRDGSVDKLREALAAAMDETGPAHPAVAYVMYTLGTTYLVNGDLEAARPMLERSLAIREEVFGPDHPDVAAILNNLGLLHQREENLDEAIPLYERALAIWKEALPDDHPIVMSSMERLVQLYRAGDRPEEADQLKQRMSERRQEEEN